MPNDPILQSFEPLVRRDPLAPLIVSPERRATVGDVDTLARAAGRRLEGQELAPGTVVALAAVNGPGFLASFLALRRAGLAALLLDGQTPAPEALRIAGALGAPGLLGCRTGWPAGPDDWEWTEVPTGTESGTLHLPDIAVLKLTSGSTGTPRGIATPAEALVADDAALTATMGIRPDDRLLTTIPLSHSYGLSSLALPALLRGTVLVIPEESSLYDPFVTAERTGATVFPTVPAYLDALVRVHEPPLRPPLLRLVLTAGAPLSAATSCRFREIFGVPVHVFYGASECGGICYDREGGAAERGTVGSPVEGVRITLEPVAGEDPADAEGAVTVESPAVASGYVPEPDLRLGGGRFRTSDLAAWRDGELVLRGRVDDLVNIKGKKVNPREVEAVLCQLAGVDEAAVLGVTVPGRPGEVLRAVVACPPGRLTAEDVVSWCRSHLSAHKVPRSVILVPRMPRTARGKLDRPALLALGADPGRG
ncbi:MAG TPA: class I adenylate-forming enzyme family protein [Thermoanaerobaculia bacterium]|nr:class I adenylate-forming enzyme family protein [Thermoanaerobaculia bacterium]